MRMDMNQGHKIGKRFIGIAVILILCLTAIALLVNIRSVTITGNNRYTDQEMADLIFSEKKDRNALYCYISNLQNKKKTIPFIDTYSLVYHSPIDVEVIVYEKAVVGYVEYMSSYLYFDMDGIIVESSTKKIEGIPWITGLEFGHLALYRQLPVKNDQIFDQILTLTQWLARYGIEVDEIQFGKGEEITLLMGDLEVEMGTGHQLDGKITRLNDMLPSLSGRKGTLYLDTYEESDSDKAFSFLPKQVN